MARAVGGVPPNLQVCKAVTDRRYTPFFGCFRFDDGLYHRQVRRRERHAAPLQWRVRSAEYHKTCNCLRRSLTAATPYFSAVSILTMACTIGKCVAGSGMPLPYNGVCGRRSATKPTSLQGGH